MTDHEFKEKIEEIARDYADDEDHWAGHFMEKIIDVIEEYNRGEIFK